MQTNRWQQTVVSAGRALGRSALAPPTRSAYSLRNDFGFWQLTFRGQDAVIPQHQALFYLAFLLANPATKPLPGTGLATKTFEIFGQHQDFKLTRSWLAAQPESSKVAEVLARKKQRLELLLDTQDHPEPIQNELLRELAIVRDFQSTLRFQASHSAASITESLLHDLCALYSSIATATDFSGNPHPVLRPFSRHLLLYVLIPSIQTGLITQPMQFTYHRPPGVLWSEIA